MTDARETPVAEVFHCVHCLGFVVVAEGAPGGDACPCGAELHPISGPLTGALYLNANMTDRESRTVLCSDPRCAPYAEDCRKYADRERVW